MPIAGALILLVALTVGVLEPGAVRTVDWQAHLWIDGHLQGDLARGISMVPAWLGQRGVVVVPLLAFALLTAMRQRSLRPVLVTLAALAGIAVVVLLFKVGVGRTAPAVGRDAVRAGGLSYPSGHAVNALVCWALVLEFAAVLGPRAAKALPPRRRRIITGAIALGAGVGMTTLDYHWVSDTVAGWLVGGLILTAVLALGPVRAGAPSISPSARPEPSRPSPSA